MAQDEFYKKASEWPVGMAVAYPRFHDIYEQAKVHPSWGKIDDDDGKTFAVTLEKALRSGLPLVQISTWNDWGEGTDDRAVQRSSATATSRSFSGLRRQIIEPGFTNGSRRPSPPAPPLQAAESREGPASVESRSSTTSHDF